MDIRKLDTWQEWLESGRIVATAFLHDWKEQEEAEKYKAEAAGTRPRDEEAWGLFDESGRMASTIVTLERRLIFAGEPVPVGDVHMVASLPERRGNGGIRRLMRAVLTDMKKRGDIFAVLHPFSFAFYRKFGFELAASSLRQKAPIDQFAPFRCDWRVKCVDCAEDTRVLKALYDDYIRDKNLAEVREEKDWTYRGGGEYGEPDWWHADKRKYTYIFFVPDGTPGAYLKFVFVPGPQGPFTGAMEVLELVYTSPEAFRNVLGFIYGMRAKITEVNLELLDDLDLAILVPEADHVERRLDGHAMARVLDPEAVLACLPFPEPGRFAVRLADDFLPENSGVYAVTGAPGQISCVVKREGEADLEVNAQTFCQLVTGLITPAEAAFRPGTRLLSNETFLAKLFVRRPVANH